MIDFDIETPSGDEIYIFRNPFFRDLYFFYCSDRYSLLPSPSPPPPLTQHLLIININHCARPQNL